MKIKTLVLYANYANTSSYFDDWLDALRADPLLKVTEHDIVSQSSSLIKNNIGFYDIIILLHSTNADNLSYLSKYTNLLNKRKGKLVVFPGNEVNLLSVSMEERINLVKDIHADYICTQLLPEAGEWLYDICKESTVISLPHALNPNVFVSKILNDQRNIDIGVRSFQYSYLLGDNDRTLLFEFFMKHHLDYDLKVDISTDYSKRFNRSGWCDFLNNCKATISNEAGSFFLEKKDTKIKLIQEYLKQAYSNEKGLIIRENSMLEKIYRKLSPSIKNFIKKVYFNNKINIKHEYFLWENVEFEEIYKHFFEHSQKPPVYTKAISSRHFDAIGTQTVQILLEGRYNDILKPYEHYIPIKLDFSNIQEAIDILKDKSEKNLIIKNAFDYVSVEHTHEKRIRLLLNTIGV